MSKFKVFLFSIILILFFPSMSNTMITYNSKTEAIPLPKGFVYLNDIDPTIITNARYATDDNFTGRPVRGYLRPVVILTEEAAFRLARVQKKVRRDGFSLVVYDGYRPQRAVNSFMHWSTVMEDQVKKKLFYPRVDKRDVFDLGYVAKKSGHSRGSTVDLTLIPLGKNLHPIKVETRTMSDGTQLPYLDDGTLDFGSSWDLFDIASHYTNPLISKEHMARRKYLKETMESFGFNNYAEEWWHFTLRDESFPNMYFDVPVN